MDLMYKFHIGGEERPKLGATLGFELYYEAPCLGKEHQN
jgi:hypothetical protein